MYFASLLPALAFANFMIEKTDGHLGVVEVGSRDELGADICVRLSLQWALEACSMRCFVGRYDAIFDPCANLLRIALAASRYYWHYRSHLNLFGDSVLGMAIAVFSADLYR